MTHLPHPSVAQRVMRKTAQEYGLRPPTPEPYPPDVVRQLLDKHPAPPQGSADAI